MTDTRRQAAEAEMNSRYECVTCDWTGQAGEEVQVVLLRKSGERESLGMVSVCPECLSVEATLIRLCDSDGCHLPASCGTPIPGGYVFSCHRHVPNEEKP